MGMPSKGTRRICVDDVDYRWIAKQLSPGVRITAQAVEFSGSLLILSTDQNFAVAHVPPSSIAAAIQAATAAGWTPTRPGPPFYSEISPE